MLGNPGDAGVGVFICHNDDASQRERISRYIGKATNNIAEYSALLVALQRASELGAQRIVVKSDSQLMVRQLHGEYKIKNETLQRLYSSAITLLKKFASVTVLHIPREENKDADRLARKAIDDYRRTNRVVALPE